MAKKKQIRLPASVSSVGLGLKEVETFVRIVAERTLAVCLDAASAVKNRHASNDLAEGAEEVIEEIEKRFGLRGE